MDVSELVVELHLLPLLSWPELLELGEASRAWRELVAGSSRWRSVELSCDLDARRVSVLLARIAVRHGSSVQRLRLVDCAVLERALVSASQLLVNLSELAVSGCRQLSDAGFVALVNGAAANSIVAVRAAKCPELTDAALDALAKRHGESLEHANFSHCRLLSSEGVAQFARSCPSLRSLALKGCRAANSASLTVVATHCPALETLLVGGAGNITDDALGAVATHCPLLKALDIMRSNPFGLGRGGVSDSAVIDLASRCWRLEHINLGGQGCLTLATVGALQQHCPRLAKLEIGGCVSITADANGLVAVLQRMSALQSLNLSFARGEHVALVAEQCAHLSVFRVDGSSRPIARAA